MQMSRESFKTWESADGQLCKQNQPHMPEWNLFFLGIDKDSAKNYIYIYLTTGP